MVVNGDMAERFTLLDETIFDNEKQAEDGGRVTYWVVEYGQRQRLVELLNEQQNTIEKQKRLIKSQDAEISRQYKLCLAMSGILREEFGVYDVFDRSKDKRVK